MMVWPVTSRLASDAKYTIVPVIDGYFAGLSRLYMVDATFQDPSACRL